MIEFLHGKIVTLTPTYAVVECGGGVGYMTNISLSTYSALEGKGETLLYVHESIREDAYQLYGFATLGEREVFRLLLSVSGVGASTARVIVSALSPQELQSAIMSEDVRVLKSIKGLGQKTAERIIVELKDKIGKLGIEGAVNAASAVGAPASSATSAVKEEALQALEVLGYNKVQAAKVIDKLLKEDPELKVEGIVKVAFRLL